MVKQLSIGNWRLSCDRCELTIAIYTSEERMAISMASTNDFHETQSGKHYCRSCVNELIEIANAKRRKVNGATALI